MEYVYCTVRSNGIKDERRMCEVDSFINFNAVGNVLFVPFLVASTREAGKFWKVLRCGYGQR